MVFSEAIALHRAGDVDGAERAYRAVLESAESAPAMCNLGSILRAKGLTDDAEQLLRRAVELEPARTPARLNLANLLWRSGRLEEAAESYADVLAIDPNIAQARRDLGNVYLALGRDEGWALYEARPEREAIARHRLTFPEWRGEPLAGKRLFILAEQGFGDLIFAARYLPLLGAGDVTFACRPELCRLFSQLPVQAIPWDVGMAVERHDFWSLPLSLPRWAKPVVGPYLAGSPQSGRGVGVVWRGSPLPDPGRSLPDDLGRALLALPGAISLHPEDTGVIDFQDTADIIAGLDRVISIDTSVAHLAGAMGKPVTVLLQHDAYDWRWRDVGPWYPTARLLRQRSPGGWRSAIEAIEA